MSPHDTIRHFSDLAWRRYMDGVESALRAAVVRIEGRMPSDHEIREHGAFEIDRATDRRVTKWRGVEILCIRSFAECELGERPGEFNRPAFY